MTENPQPPQKDVVEDKTLGNEIFVITGKDPAMNKPVTEYLKSLGLNLILNRGEGNRQISIVKEMNSHRHIHHAVVILSPDELVYDKDKKPADAYAAAEQQNAFGFGFLLGHLGRENVICIYYEQKKFKVPCEFFDAFFIPFYPIHDQWKKQLLAKLKEFNLSLKN